MSFAQQLKGMKKKKKAKGIEKEPSQSLESLQERDATSRSVEEDVQELLRFEGPRLMTDVAAKESAMASDEADAVAEALEDVRTKCRDSSSCQGVACQECEYLSCHDEFALPTMHRSAFFGAQ